MCAFRMDSGSHWSHLWEAEAAVPQCVCVRVLQTET